MNEPHREHIGRNQYGFDQSIDGVLVVRPPKPTLTGVEDPKLSETVAVAHELYPGSDVVIDLSGTRWMTSKGLGQVLASMDLYTTQPQPYEGPEMGEGVLADVGPRPTILRVCGATTRVSEIMRVTGVSSMLPDYGRPLEDVLAEYYPES